MPGSPTDERAATARQPIAAMLAAGTKTHALPRGSVKAGMLSLPDHRRGLRLARQRLPAEAGLAASGTRLKAGAGASGVPEAHGQSRPGHLP